jgi:hypothetical protein
VKGSIKKYIFGSGVVVRKEEEGNKGRSKGKRIRRGKRRNTGNKKTREVTYGY